MWKAPSVVRYFVESFTEYWESNMDHCRDHDETTRMALFHHSKNILGTRRHNIGGRSILFMGELIEVE